MGTYACLREVKFACSECNQLLRGIDLPGSLESPACHEGVESFYYGRRLNARTQFQVMRPHPRDLHSGLLGLLSAGSPGLTGFALFSIVPWKILIVFLVRDLIACFTPTSVKQSPVKHCLENKLFSKDAAGRTLAIAPKLLHLTYWKGGKPLDLMQEHQQELPSQFGAVYTWVLPLHLTRMCVYTSHFPSSSALQEVTDSDQVIEMEVRVHL